MVDAALERVDARVRRKPAAAHTAPARRRHLGNILWTAAGRILVDLDDALTGPAVWDLDAGVRDRAPSASASSAVLDGHEQFMDFDRRERSR